MQRTQIRPQAKGQRTLRHHSIGIAPKSGCARLVLICASALAAALGSASGFAQSRDNGASTPQKSRAGTVLIYPFENDSHLASVDWLGEGLAELTSERLAEQGVSVLSRQERLAALEKIGLPASARFSHATLVKIAAQADADQLVFGNFVSDGKTVTFQARVMQLSPPSLSAPIEQTSSVQDLLQSDERLSSLVRCAIERRDCTGPSPIGPEIRNTAPPIVPRLDALENFVRGIEAMDDEPRVRALREASRLEPVWDRPPFELGLHYFEKRDCELALPWLSRVPPDRPDGMESEFMTGVCHLLRNEAARAEASFTSLIERSRNKTTGDSPTELPQAHNNLGVARLRLGRWSDAAAEFERAAAIDSEEPDYRVNLGLAKLGSKQTAAAVIEFEHARDLDPMDKGVRSLLAAALELAGRSSEAATIRSGAIDSSVPASPDSVAIAKLARITMRLDRGLLSLPEGTPVADPPIKNSAPTTPHGGA